MEAVPDGTETHPSGAESGGVSSTEDAPPLTAAIAGAAMQPDDAEDADDAAQLVSGCWGELPFAGSDVLLAVGMALLCLVQNPLTTAEISSAGQIGSSSAERALLVLSERRNPLFGHLLYNIPGTAGPDRPPLLASQLLAELVALLALLHVRCELDAAVWVKVRPPLPIPLPSHAPSPPAAPPTAGPVDHRALRAARRAHRRLHRAAARADGHADREQGALRRGDARGAPLPSRPLEQQPPRPLPRIPLTPPIPRLSSSCHEQVDVTRALPHMHLDTIKEMEATVLKLLRWRVTIMDGAEWSQYQHGLAALLRDNRAELDGFVSRNAAVINGIVEVQVFPSPPPPPPPLIAAAAVPSPAVQMEVSAVELDGHGQADQQTGAGEAS